MNEDLLIMEVVTLKEDVRQIKEKVIKIDDLQVSIDGLTTTLDEILGIVKKLDQKIPWARFA